MRVLLAFQLVGKNGFPPDGAVVALVDGGVVNIGSTTLAREEGGRNVRGAVERYAGILPIPRRLLFYGSSPDIIGGALY